MQDFVRIGSYVWPYRRLFVLSVVCAVIVSLFWAMNLSFAFPVVKILFQNDSLHGREVVVLDRLPRHEAGAVEREDRLDHDRAAQHESQLHRGQADHGDDRVPERVLKQHLARPETLGPGRPDVV